MYGVCRVVAKCIAAVNEGSMSSLQVHEPVVKVIRVVLFLFLSVLSVSLLITVLMCKMYKEENSP